MHNPASINIGTPNIAEMRSNGNNYVPVTVTAKQAIKASVPCDFSLQFSFALTPSATPITNSATLADVGGFTVGSQSGTSLTLSSAPTDYLLPNATLATSAGPVLDSGGNPVRIKTCPTGGCNATGSTFTLTSAPASTMSGSYVAQATNLNACQVVNLIGVDSGAAVAVPLPGDTAPERTVIKHKRWVEHTHEIVPATKTDTHNAAVFSNGARIGNWPLRFGTGQTGRVSNPRPYMAAESSGGNYLCYAHGGFCGETVPPTQFYRNDGTQYANLSALRVVDDKSTGGVDLNGPATLTYPALNIGQGGYAPAPSITLTIAGAISAVGRTAVSMNATSLNAAIVMPGMGVIDASGAFVGTVANYSGTTLTLASPGALTTESAGASLSFSAA